VRCATSKNGLDFGDVIRIKLRQGFSGDLRYLNASCLFCYITIIMIYYAIRQHIKKQWSTTKAQVYIKTVRLRDKVTMEH